MDESSLMQNRRSRRSNVLMAAQIESGAAVCDVKLRNLSADGALVEGDGIPEANCPVVFRKKDLVIPGRIAWVNDRRAGIAFDRKLEPEALMRHIPEPRQRVETRTKRPRVTAHALSEEERRWCENYLWQAPNISVER